MDTLTHVLAGALLAQGGYRQRYGPAATAALIIGAGLPDIDVLFDLAGPVTGFQYHRGITHAFLGGIGLALLGAALLRGVLRYHNYWRLAALAYLGVLLHIWMDYLTSYGTQVFLPFHAGRYTADAVFIIDLFYTGIIVTALLLGRMVRRQRQERYGTNGLAGVLLGSAVWFSAPLFGQHPLLLLALRSLGIHVSLFALAVAILARHTRQWQPQRHLVFGRYGIVALAAYMALCLGNHEVAKQRFLTVLGPQMATVQQVAMLPQPGSPLLWRGIARTGSGYLVSQVSLLPATVSVPQSIAKEPDNEVVRATSDYRLVRIFQDFARFPVIEYSQRENEQVVRYFDLRFTGYGREKSWFDLVIRLDGTGHVQAIEFLNRVFLPHHPDFS